MLELLDTAFPEGFIVPAGVDVTRLIDQLAHGSLPLVAAVHGAPAQVNEIDALADALLFNPVAARASRDQGRGLLNLAARTSDHPVLVSAAAEHLAPVFGLVCQTLGVTRDDTLAAFLELAVRGVRGSYLVHHRLQPALDRALAIGRTLPLEDVVSEPHATGEKARHRAGLQDDERHSAQDDLHAARSRELVVRREAG